MNINDFIENPSIAGEFNIELPSFDRAKAKQGIVHIGVGRFHRAHQAAYIQELMNAGALEWGICGVSLLPQDKAFVDAFKAQNRYYTLIEQNQNNTRFRIIGSILDIIPGYESPAAVIEKIGHKDIKIVSLTVTESGYFYHPSNLELQWEHPLLKHDMQNLESPKTIYGYLLAGLLHRQAQGPSISLPLTIQSCDNIQGNGDLLRKLMTDFIDRVSPDIRDWFENNISFPNAMVDRITPAASDNEQKLLSKFGIEDPLAIIAEPTRQWVLEDNFKSVRPDFASVGVQITNSVKPFEHMKVRLLNAGHSAIGYLGALAGFHKIHEIVLNETMNHFLQRFLADAAHTVPAPEGISLSEYAATLVERFSNPVLEDQTLRICKDGAAKIPGFIIPSLIELLEKDNTHGSNTNSYALVLASWYQFIAKTLEDKGALDDIEAEKIVEMYTASNGSAKTFYQAESLFGNLAKYTDFLARVDEYSLRIKHEPVLEVVASFD